MSYDHYRYLIEKTVDSCSFETLDQFCRDVVSRMLDHIQSDEMTSLKKREFTLVTNLISMVQQNPLPWDQAGAILDEISELEDQADIEDAIEGDLMEFLCAMDSWRDLQDNKVPIAAAAVSESLMNMLDAKVDPAKRSDEWLSVPPLRDEFARQVHFLKAAA
ncbi:hypothetical protein [Thiolinea disciformis]|uniref:hypothetical protein n=1 Tax=Thiolinea disciformis TaxID=125614 RepID=UPI000364438A|nr:hypothetical protein [Thiolinea disciformis]